MRYRRLMLRDMIVMVLLVGLLMFNLCFLTQRGRIRSRSLLCRANLKKWGELFYEYTDDHNGMFMKGLTGENWDGSWHKQLIPYYTNHIGLMLCPEATDSFYFYQPVGCAGGYPCGEVFAPYYGINNFIYNAISLSTVDPLPHNTVFDLWRTPYVKQSSMVPLFGDCDRAGVWPHQSDQPPRYLGEPPLHPNEDNMRIVLQAGYRHGGFPNWVFLDGSVHHFGLRAPWKLKWHRTFDLDNRYTHPEYTSLWPDWLLGHSDQIY